VIATRSGCFNDMVFDGVSGILSEPNDAKSLAEAINQFFAHDGPERFHPGIQKAKNLFSWDAIVDAIEDLLTDE
jgi:glycosyltransferase involved in cell wall biosynthesis